MLTMHEGKLLFGSQCSTPIQHDTYGITELNDGEWHHVAATYDENGGDNNLRVYVDGVLEGQSTKTGQFVTGDFTIASSPAPGEYFDGNIDMLRIWNSALTQEQIQENMYSSVANMDTDLLQTGDLIQVMVIFYLITQEIQIMVKLMEPLGMKKDINLLKFL